MKDVTPKVELKTQWSQPGTGWEEQCGQREQRGSRSWGDSQGRVWRTGGHQCSWSMGCEEEVQETRPERGPQTGRVCQESVRVSAPSWPPCSKGTVDRS